MTFLSPLLKLENLSKYPIMSLDHLPEHKRYNKNHIVAKWLFAIKGKMYRIEMEHGTTTGRRMIWVNGREVLRRDWMFKLVGEDTFYIDQVRCIVRVDPAPGFKYEYLLFIDGKPYDQYSDDMGKRYRFWLANLNNIDYRIMLDVSTLDLYVNDELREEKREFVDNGTDIHFQVDGNAFVLETRSSGNRREGVVHSLIINGEIVPEAKIQEIIQEPISIRT